MQKPPSDDEIEITVFGPGYGEGITIHIGQKKWIVIDSCINPKTNKSTILEYFNEIGVNPARAVKYIIATHWHDDHIKGLSEIMLACENAKFVCSEAIHTDEFLTLIECIGNSPFLPRPGLQEFYNILNILKERNTTQHWAIEGRMILEENIDCSGGKYLCKIFSLSPSDYSVTASKLQIGTLVPSVTATKRAIVSLTPNHAAIVLLVNICGESILLGSDLQDANNRQCGWLRILDIDDIPITKSFLYKIAHHGSSKSDIPQIWTKLLIDNPKTITTPFNKGSNSLPTINDLKRISTYSENSFLTSPPIKLIKLKLNPVVEKTIRGVVRYIGKYYYSTGHVQVRGKLKKGELIDWNVYLFGSAISVKEYLNSIAS